MATKTGVLQELLKSWCEKHDKTEEQFFHKCAKDRWDADRFILYWKRKQKIMHRVPMDFLLQEMCDDPRTKTTPRNSQENNS